MRDVLEGLYKLEVYEGEALVNERLQRNLIVNTGRNDYGTVGFDQLVRQVRVGISNVPEASEQSNVLAEYQRLLAVSNRQIDGVLGDETARVTFNFATGQLDNADIYEVGTFARGQVSTGDLNGQNARMFSRTVLRGTGGSPSAVHVANHQRLVITFERRKTYPIIERRISVPISGLGTYQATLVTTDRHFAINNGEFQCFTPQSVEDLIVISDPAFAATTGNFRPDLLVQGSHEVLSGAVTPDPYTYNSYSRTKNALIDYTRGNQGVKALVIRQGSLHPYALVFDQIVPKDEDTRLHISLQLDWS